MAFEKFDTTENSHDVSIEQTESSECNETEKNNEELFDDNGKQYRSADGGWIPNNEYEIDGSTYKTDDLGNVYETDGKYYPNDFFVLDGILYMTDEDGNLIIDDMPNKEQNDTSETNDTHEGDDKIEKGVEDRIKELLSTTDGIKELIEKHPELAEKFEKAEEAIEVLNDPDSTPQEKNQASRYLGQFKGALLEAATKEALSEIGLDVEDKQRTTEGENGNTRPDVIAKNNTDNTITVFGVKVKPGETLSVECKCGKKEYISHELNSHIPNQLSGQEGKRILLTTSNVDIEKAKKVCDEHNATLVVLDVDTNTLTDVIKEEVDK